MLESRAEGGFRAVQAPEQWGTRTLPRFGVANHLSIIRDFQELSFSASPLRDRRDGLIAREAAPGGSVVPAAVVYDANASGKNLVRAMRTMQRMVLFSQTKCEPGGGVSRQPFLIDAARSKESSRFELDLVVVGARHHYGFEASDAASNPNGCTPFRSHTGEFCSSAKGANSISGAG